MVYLQDIISDPTILYAFLCIGIMATKKLLAGDFMIVLTFFVNPCVLFSLALGLATVYWSSLGNKSRTLSRSDLYSSNWYLVNGVVFHLMFDGFSGSLQSIPLIVDQYKVLDNRFNTHHAVPWVIGIIEMLVMAPLCFLTYRAIRRNLPSRYPLELMVAILHAFGMVLFCAVEIYEGNLNVPAVDPIGNSNGRFANLKFTENHLTYWWFGFLFSEAIWGIVPFFLGRRAFRKIIELQTKNK
eukprot:TRINITY_DN64_c0_g1_i1.p1 TRINITY_DN64_c0_g1~~TRINITY_DN64_c0_g1_i1.p1  ORF type:complete len:277 (+),score=47.68 TRINITY_DN64_c0_g1_i1:110-832(+)